MPIRAYLVLYRNLLLWCAFFALLIPITVVLFTTSDNGIDFGVFWNHFCGCAPGRGDTFALLYLSSFTAFLIGLLFSFANRATGTSVGTASAAGLGSGMPYTFTRPMRRSTALWTPVLIAFPAIAMFPVLGFAIVFGWLHLVHAPAIVFFPQALRLLPEAAALPPNASLLSLLVADHAISIYLGSVSIGLLIYVCLYSQRWLMLSRHPWVRKAAAFQTTVLFLPLLSRRITPRVGNWVFLTPQHQNLAWHPSPLLLLLHYAISAALLYGSWRTLKSADF